MKPRLNPLLVRGRGDPTADVRAIGAPTVHRGRARRRDMRILFRKESAVESIGQLERGCEIFGFTKGQFSLIDLLEAIIEQTGPVNLSLSTWTAAQADIERAYAFMTAGAIRSVRLLVDFSFQRRAPEIAAAVREKFGPESVRVSRNHAKFAVMRNDAWTLAVRTSMNLNMNPRFEDFEISDDPALCDFFDAILDELFANTPQGTGEGVAPQAHKDAFARHGERRRAKA